MPIVTVLVNTVDHQSFIAKALSSIVEQNFPAADTEIIVVDDGSTDLTPEIVRQFLPRIKFIRKENDGLLNKITGSRRTNSDVGYTRATDGANHAAPRDPTCGSRMGHIRSYLLYFFGLPALVRRCHVVRV